MRSGLLIVAVAAPGIVAVASATSGGAAENELSGLVTSSGEIVLRDASGPVRRIAPGTYTIQVRDTTADHNFHLKGPGVDRATEVEEATSVTWTEALARGAYSYLCDLHPGYMLRTFQVGDAQPTAALSVSAVSVAVRNRTLTVRLRVNKKANAAVALLRRSKLVIAQSAALRRGANVIRLTLPRRHPGGTHVVRITVRDAAGTTRVVRRTVRLPRR